MNANTKPEMNALTLPERAAVALGDSANEAKLRELVTKSAGIVSVTNVDGREEAHRAGMVLLKTRTGIRATGKAAREDAQKFSKAVIAMEDQMIAIIEPEEHRVLALRDAFDEKVAAEKAALIAAERARIEHIADCIAGIREDESDAIRIDKTAEQTRATLAHAEARTISEEVFQERFAEAVEIHAAVLVSIRAVLAERVAAEQAAAEAEAARQAEIARIAAEREELAQLRAAAAESARLTKIETDRIAAEQAAEARRLAEAAAAQAAEAQRIQQQTEANMRAEREAQALAMRLEREKAAQEQAERDRAAADTKRQLEEQAAQIAADRKALEAEKAAVQDAARREDDHGPALAMNAEHDRARLQALADQHLTDKRDAAEVQRITGVAMPSLPYAELGALTDAAVDDLWPTDEDIVDALVEAFNMDRPEIIARLAKFNSVAALAELEAV